MCATILHPSLQAPTATQHTLRYSYFRSIETAGCDWDAAAPQHDIFLQRAYLSIVENNPPEGMRFGYLVFYLDEEPDRKSTRLNSSHLDLSRMPSSA